MNNYCPQCGRAESHFREGVCVYCCQQNQQEINRFRAEQVYWNSLTEQQKDSEIRGVE